MALAFLDDRARRRDLAVHRFFGAAGWVLSADFPGFTAEQQIERLREALIEAQAAIEAAGQEPAA